MRIILGLLLVVCGCAPRGGGAPHVQDQTVSQVRVTQRERTNAFNELVGRGVIEFRWEDEDGKHKQQGDLDFWKQGNSVSMWISKLGDPIVWLGGNADAYWFFDLTSDETSLSIGGDSSLFSDIQISLILLGLESLPAGEMSIDNGIITLQDESGRTWTASFEPTTNRPLEIHVDRGNGRSSALHRTGIRVEIAHTLDLFWPSTGGLIDLEDSHETTKIKIAFSSLSTIVDEEPMDRVFDLDVLRGALKPTVIIDQSHE
jgi:hypothetical protein